MSFPRHHGILWLASLAWLAALAAPAAAQASDSFAGDDRLRALRTLRYEGRTLGEILDELGKQEGIALSADNTERERRVTLIAHGRPLRSSLSALAVLLDLQWQRDQRAGPPAYRLSPAPGKDTADPTTPTPAEVMVADEILRELALYRKYKTASQDERERRAGELRAEMAGATPLKMAELRTEWIVLRSFSMSSALTVASDAFGQIDRAGIIAMLRGDRTTFAWPETPGLQPMTAEQAASASAASNIRVRQFVLGGRMRADRLDFYPIGLPEYKPDWVILSFSSERQMVPMLRMDVADGSISGRSPSRGVRSQVLPLLHPMMMSPPQVAPPAEEIAKHVWLGRPVALAPAYRGGLEGMVRALDDARPIDLAVELADSGGVSGAETTASTVADVLTEIARLTRHRWMLYDNFALLPAVFTDSGDDEVHVDRRKLAEAPSGLDRLAELAALPAAQAEAALNAFSYAGQPQPERAWGPTLRLWRALSPEQRQKARKAGVWYRELTVEQRRLYARAIAGEEEPTLTSEGVPPGWTTTQLWESKMALDSRVEPVVPAAWECEHAGYRTVISAPSRRRALQAVRRLDPELRLDDLHPQQRETATIEFFADQVPKRAVWIVCAPR